jgi:hypothetical protein
VLTNQSGSKSLSNLCQFSHKLKEIHFFFFNFVEFLYCLWADNVCLFHVKDRGGGSISVMNLVEVLSGSSDNSSSVGGSTSCYFDALCQQSFPGPLVGGNVGNKELNKWIDERIAHCELPDVNHKKGKALRLLLSLLKLACQHYGKLRSSFGTDNLLKVKYKFLFQ